MIENKVILATGEIVGASQLKVGDVLLGPNGTKSEVLGIKKTSEKVYKITSKTGLPFYVTKDNFLCNASGSEQVQAISFRGKTEWHSNNKVNELCRADFVDFPEQSEVPIPPYLFGILLMNSSTNFGRVRISAKKGTYMREAIMNELLPLLRMEVNKESTKNSNSFFIHNIPKRGRVSREKNRLIEVMASLGLDGVNVPSRFIPDCYKYGTVEQRKELIAAIIDCSAYTEGGSFVITLASEKLASDLTFTARSIGLIATHRIAVKAERTYQIVVLKGDSARMQLPLKNKVAREKKTTTRKKFEIEHVGKRKIAQIVTSGSYLTEDFTIIR